MILTWSRGCADDNMPEEILVDLRSRVLRHPWWQARTTLAADLLKEIGIRPPASIMDAGCGWGSNLLALEKMGYRTTGMDISRRCLEGLEAPGRTLIEADLTQRLPSDAPEYDAVLALDVIEHLDDDAATVSSLARLVRPGGAMIVSVPALPSLYSEFDSIQGHRRRYTPETLRAAFEQSGLESPEIIWWGGWMVPVLRRHRRGERADRGESPAETYRRYLSVPRWPLLALIRLAFQIDRWWTLRRWNHTGTSLLAVARHA